MTSVAVVLVPVVGTVMFIGIPVDMCRVLTVLLRSVVIVTVVDTTVGATALLTSDINSVMFGVAVVTFPLAVYSL